MSGFTRLRALGLHGMPRHLNKLRDGHCGKATTCHELSITTRANRQGVFSRKALSGTQARVTIGDLVKYGFWSGEEIPGVRRPVTIRVRTA